MSASQASGTERTESPDPSSHAATIYDDQPNENEWTDEQDDDDMDFEPTTDESEDVEFFDPEDEVEGEYHDAEGNLSGVEIEFGGDDGSPGADRDAEGTETPRQEGAAHGGPNAATGPTRIHVPAQIMQLLGHAGLRQLLANHRAELVDDDEENGDAYGGLGSRRRRRPRGEKPKLPDVPSVEGRRLMDSGLFGISDYYRDARRKRSKRLARRLLTRELGNDPGNGARTTVAMSQDLIPSSTADTIIHYNSRCYSGQFSDDGNFFFSCAQDFKVRMYDTSNPYRWRYYKTVDYHLGQWTITDASLSPDNKYLAYSSMRSIVCLAPTDPADTGEPHALNICDMGTGRRRGIRGGWDGYANHMSVYSIRFSGDGREIVAGTGSHSVYVYDIEKRQSVLSINGHGDDVNAVCFGDTSSPHILYSGSDDTLIKVWDRRSMGDSREAGVFMGHTEGVTYVDSKGDGRYVLSNGKDQSMKLWDLRKMMSTESSASIDPRRYTTAFDYRFMDFSDQDWRPHPHDCSLVTYRGHSVLKTLIRCHFSPPGSTNSRYVYSGSDDGSVYVYNMDATLAGKVDVGQATHHSRPRDRSLDMHTYSMDDRGQRSTWKTCVRDASWHPNAPVIAATSWNGWGGSTGTCTTHSWNDGAEDDEGSPPMAARVDPKLRHDNKFYGNEQSVPRPQSRFRAGLRSRRVAVDAEDDDQGADW